MNADKSARCEAHVVLDFDSVDCDLDVGHLGFHSTQGDGRRILWVEKHSGSTGYMSPRNTWPDDTEADAAIAEADTLEEAFWEVGEKYDIPTTSNSPRWQEGRFLRSMYAFISDCIEVTNRFRGKQAPGDGEPMSEPPHSVSSRG